MRTNPQQTAGDILQESKSLVIKFGGDNAGEFKVNADLARRTLQEGKQLTMVFSAIRSSAPEAARYSQFTAQENKKESAQFNTTSHLIRMAEAAERGDLQTALCCLNAVRDFTKSTLSSIDDSTIRLEMEVLVEEECEELRGYIEEAASIHSLAKSAVFFSQGTDRMFASTRSGEKYVSFTGFGEDLAEKLYALYFARLGIPRHALEAGSISNDIFKENPREAIEKRGQIVEAVQVLLRQKMADIFPTADGSKPVLLSGGRLPGAAESRGYSDVAAVVLARAQGQSEEGGSLVWIAKQGPIESADPKLVQEGRRIAGRFAQTTAIEAFDPNGADAAALHPDAAKLLEKGMNVVVGNPSAPTNRLSWISAEHSFEEAKGPQLVAFKKVQNALEVSGGDMVERPGVLEQIVRGFGDVSVGHLHTDAATVLVTFNETPKEGMDSVLQERLRELFDRGYTVRFVNDVAWVFCIGNRLGLRDKRKAYEVLESEGVEPIREVSSGQVFKVLVSAAEAERLTRALHSEFFPTSATLSV